MRKIILASVTSVLALGNAAMAQEFQVKVTDISAELGSVTVQRGSELLPLTDVSLVYANDIVTTSSIGFVTLSQNGCEVTLSGDNYYVIDESSFCNTKAYALDCACEGGILPVQDTAIAAPQPIATSPAPAAPAPTKVAAISAPNPVVASTGSQPRTGLLFGAAAITAVGLAAAASSGGGSSGATAASPS